MCAVMKVTQSNIILESSVSGGNQPWFWILALPFISQPYDLQRLASSLLQCIPVKGSDILMHVIFLLPTRKLEVPKALTETTLGCMALAFVIDGKLMIVQYRTYRVVVTCVRVGGR